MAKAKRLSCFVVNLEDRPGELLRIMKELKAKKVNLSGLWGFSVGEGKAQLYTVAAKSEELRKALASAGLAVEEQAAFFVKGADRTGALLNTLEAIAEKGINIEAIDAIAVGGRFGSFVWFKKEDVDRATQALT